MSYTFLLEQGEESSAESFSAIPASVLLKLNLTAGKSCSNDSGTESCQSSRSGMMCEPSTGSHGAERSIASAGAFHVRTSAFAEKAKASTANDPGFGKKCGESLARYDRASRSWRTRQLSLFEGLGECLETWPRWGMMRGGECWAMMTLVDNTEESEYGLLPTPTKELFSYWESAKKKISNGGKRKSGVKIGSIFWWAMTEKHLRFGGPEDKTLIPDPSCGEELMGWPLDWTELTPLATAKFQRWRQAHSAFFREV